MEDLKKFLAEAKKKTYATNEITKVRLDDGADEFSYSQGDLTYRDRYYGGLRFLGEETVFKEGKVIWGMNYWGDTLSGCKDVKQMVRVLKNALRSVSREQPFRGPEKIIEGDYVYTNKIDGDIEHFSGVESIGLNGVEIFRLYYHGGLVI